MFQLVLLQVLTTAIVSLASGLIAGPHAAVSALLGGAACFIPNGLFALKLAAVARRPQGTDVAVSQAAVSQAAVFLVGEVVKVVATIALLALIVASYRNLVWLAMMVSIIAVLKSYVLALLIKRY